MRIKAPTLLEREPPWVRIIDHLDAALGQAERIEHARFGPLDYQWPGVYLDASQPRYDIWTVTDPEWQLWFMLNMPDDGEVLP